MNISKTFLILLGIVLAVSKVCYGQNTAQNNTVANTVNNNAVNVAANDNSSQITNRPADTPVKPAPANGNIAQSNPANSQTTTTTQNDPVVIEDVYNFKYENDKDNRKNAGINDIIVLKVKNLKKLVDLSLCRDKGVRIANCTNQKIALFIEGRKIDSMEPESIQLDGSDGTIQFHLTRNTDVNDEAWADLLGNPSWKQFFFRDETKVSIGLENEYPVTPGKTFDLRRIHKYWFWGATILYGLLLFLIFRLADRSDILRDIGEQPDGSEDRKAYGIGRAFEPRKENKDRKPYSLARCQMAFWFLLVIGSFFYIWLITGALDIITTEILALIGIGAGTALGAAAIDRGNRETVKTGIESKREEISKLELEIAELDSRIKASPPDLSVLEVDKKTKYEKLQNLRRKLENCEKTFDNGSKGFLKDVLSGNEGVSFHRFQIFIWTLVLGIIFIISVWTRLSMPEFGATLLALLGISAGTYLGFKIPENETGG